MITVLAGGVGAARFLYGLLAVRPHSEVTIVSDVGDDAEFFSRRFSKYIDIAFYHLAHHGPAAAPSSQPPARSRYSNSWNSGRRRLITNHRLMDYAPGV